MTMGLFHSIDTYMAIKPKYPNSNLKLRIMSHKAINPLNTLSLNPLKRAPEAIKVKAAALFHVMTCSQARQNKAILPFAKIDDCTNKREQQLGLSHGPNVKRKTKT